MSDDKPKDGLMTLLDSDETKQELADTRAKQDKLAADEAAVEADPKVKVALAIDKIRALLDEAQSYFEFIPDPTLRTVLVDVTSGVNAADDLLAKLGL